MPTGYTAILVEKPETSFETFALRCARAMCVLVRMRDCSLDAEIPTELKPDTYYKEQLDKAYAEMRELETMTLEEAGRRAEEDYRRQVKSKADAEERWAKEDRIYAEMLAKVDAWKAPTESHEGLRRFMQEQIQTSMNGTIDWPTHRMTGKTWLEHARERVAERIRSAAEDWAKEQRRAREGTQWLADLRASLTSGGDT
jgi:hypothetical protein